MDASLFKRFSVGDRRNLEFRVEAQNVFNHVNLANPELQLSASPGTCHSNAGFITSTAPNWLPRALQFALRLEF